MDREQLQKCFGLMREARDHRAWSLKSAELAESCRCMANVALAAANLADGLHTYMPDKPLCFFAGGIKSNTVDNVPMAVLHRYATAAQMVRMSASEDAPESSHLEIYVPAIIIKSTSAGVIGAMMVPEGSIATTMGFLRSDIYNDNHGVLMRMLVLVFGEQNTGPISDVLSQIRSIDKIEECPMFMHTN